MSAIPRPVTASSYLKHHPDLVFSSRCNSYSSSSPQALCQMSSSPLQNMSTQQTSSFISLPVSTQLLRPLSPVEHVLHSFQQEYSGSSSYNSTESLVSVLGHQSYDSDQCQSPKTDTRSPGNNGDSNSRKGYDCSTGYVQSPLAKSSPLEKSSAGDRIIETVNTDTIMFGSSQGVASNRLPTEQIVNEANNEHKRQSSLMSQLKQARDSDNINGTGDDDYNYNDYSNQDNDYSFSLNMSLPATNLKPRRSKKNRQRDDFANVLSETLAADKDKHLAEKGLSVLGNRDPLQLTAWEQWMLRKAKLEREKRLEELKRVTKAKTLVEKATHDKNEKEKRIQEQLGQWCLKKRMDNDLKKLKKRQQELMAEQQRRHKQEVEQRAEENFRLWLAAKAQLTRESKQREKDRHEKQEEEQRQRRKMSTVEFEKWCEKVENRGRRRHNSVSSSNSKSTPFTEPEPSFYNPIPWQPTVIPSPKTNQRCHPCRSRYVLRAKCW